MEEKFSTMRVRLADKDRLDALKVHKAQPDYEVITEAITALEEKRHNKPKMPNIIDDAPGFLKDITKIDVVDNIKSQAEQPVG